MNRPILDNVLPTLLGPVRALLDKKADDKDVVKSVNGSKPDAEGNVDVSDGSLTPEPYGLPILYMNGDTAGMNKDNEVALNYVFGERAGTLTCKWQGGSSLAYDKKNYTVVFDTAFEAAEGWGEHSKYCLKANWIDFSHIRNVIGAKLWGQVCKTRGDQFNFYSLPNCGAIDGFPIMVVINGAYQGLYSFNIPKDAWMFGMTGAADGECIISAENHTDATAFKAAALMDGTDFEYEYVGTDNEGVRSYITTQFNTIHEKLAAVNSYDTLYSEVGAVFDLQSAIDYMIFTALLTADDCIGKNYLIVSTSGGYFQFSAYDLDSIFGNNWDGKSYLPVSRCSIAEIATRSAFFDAILKYTPDSLAGRYWQLRYGVLSEENVGNLVENYMAQIPKAAYDEEVRIWPGIPGTATNGMTQILNNYRLKLAKLDYEFSQLVPEA